MAAFLARRIGFLDIARIVAAGAGRLRLRACDDLDDVLACDAEARRRPPRSSLGATGSRHPHEGPECSHARDHHASISIPFLIVLSVVVFVHEFGHYWVARRNGVRVEMFSIGFGPELFGRNDRHGTRWKFSADPARRLRQDAGRRRRRPARPSISRHARDPDSFPAKSVWQRMAIVVAGPVANFLFAIVALAILFAISRPAVHAARGRRGPGRQPGCGGRPAARRPDRGGRRRADRELRGAAGDGARQCGPAAALSRRPRGRAAGRSPSRPAASEIEDRFGNQHQVGLIGVSRAGVEYRRSNPFLALFEAVGETGRMIGGTLYALGQMVVGSRGTAGARRAAADRADVGPDRAGRLRAGLVVHRRAVDQSRPDQPVPDPDAGRRAPR